MTTSTITAGIKGDPQHDVEGIIETKWRSERRRSFDPLYLLVAWHRSRAGFYCFRSRNVCAEIVLDLSNAVLHERTYNSKHCCINCFEKGLHSIC